VIFGIPWCRVTHAFPIQRSVIPVRRSHRVSLKGTNVESW